MSLSANQIQRGTIYTFYSFKGGVGRTMALANVGALLAKWGFSVLVVDWDLEAPGVERFFMRENPNIQELRSTRPGILDLVQSRKNGEAIHWRDCLLEVEVAANSAKLFLLTAGRSDSDYSSRLHALDFPELFEKHDLGAYIEDLRNQWIAEYDFVLVDSRTGVTDIGGICTVHLADILVLMFTTTESSMEGAKDIVERARKAQERLPLDRRRLLAVPVPGKDESRTEYEKAMSWKNLFAERFGSLYADWLPTGMTAHDAIDVLRIPYIPYWSFGEQLPVTEEGTSDPSSLGRAYETLARLIAARLDWYEALRGLTAASPPVPRLRKLDSDWLARHRRAAMDGLIKWGKTGFMEVYHLCPDVIMNKTQQELVAAAKQAMIHASGWPIGAVFDREDFKPRPTNDGIFAVTRTERRFDYWSLNKTGDFYTLMSLIEDTRSESAMYFDERIARAVEALLHCSNLYRVLGVAPSVQVELTMRYGGLRGRSLEGHEAPIPWR